MIRDLVEEGRKKLELIAGAVSKPPYLMLGCGGSISTKIGSDYMLMAELKYNVKQNGKNSRYMVINYKNIRTYYSMVDIKLDMDFDKINDILIRQNTIQRCNTLQKHNDTLQIFLEAGFHSLLDTYVIHTHSAYANILGCGESGEELMHTIFSDEGLDCFWIPCSEPGFLMTYLIKEAMEGSGKDTIYKPRVFFLENHGLIVTSDDMQEAIDTGIMVNNCIKGYFQIKERHIC